MKRSIIFILQPLLIVMFCVLGCAGGGTSGSGVIVVRGIVKTESGSPLPNASVEVLETGDKTSTDSVGRFIVSSPSHPDTITLELSKDSLQTTVSITPIPPAVTDVTVAITVAPEENTAEATIVDYAQIQTFELTAAVVGLCDFYFENRGERIRQSNPLSDGTECILKTKVYADEVPLGGVSVGIERKGCDKKAKWKEVATARTESEIHEGIAQIPFKFYDNDRSACFYRVSAPYKDSKDRQSYIYIVTRSGQRKEAELQP